MFQDFFKSMVRACALLILLAPGSVGANSETWESNFARVVMQHPDIQAARAELEAGLARAKVYASPLYNPALEAELESEGSDTNFRVGVSQTLDWWDKQSVASGQSESLVAEARAQFLQQLQQLGAEGLRAVAAYDAARRSLELAQEQEAQQRQILQLIERRQQAGDLGQVDAELARLALIQRVSESARLSAELIRLKARLGKALPEFSAPFSIPDSVWENIDRQARLQQYEEWVQVHPAVSRARVQWEGRKNEARLSRLEAKAEPELGIGAGRSGDDSVFAITLNLPLNVRNDFSSNVEAANQAVTSAQAEYQAVMKNQLAEMQASHAVMQQYAEHHAQWEQMTSGQQSRQTALLERLWSAGELSTTEYLNILQQGSEAMAAGLELKAGLDLARIDWALQSGLIGDLFSLPTD